MAVDIEHPRSTASPAGKPPAIYRDFRAHNERRARLLEARRRQQIERARQLIHKNKLNRR